MALLVSFFCFNVSFSQDHQFCSVNLGLSHIHDPLKKNEMSGARGTHGGKEKCMWCSDGET